MVLGQHVADVVVWLQRELGEEYEARALDVLFRTLGDQEEVFVQADQLLGQLLPRLLFLVPGLDLPELHRSFFDRVVQLDLLLYP